MTGRKRLGKAQRAKVKRRLEAALAAQRQQHQEQLPLPTMPENEALGTVLHHPVEVSQALVELVALSYPPAAV